MTDPVGDLLTRIRNGQSARLESVTCRPRACGSNVLDVLQREAISAAWFEEELRPGVKELRVELKYDNGRPVIKEIKRVSTPGRRVYSKIRELPRHFNGLGISILSTPRGVMSDAEARAANVRRRSHLQGCFSHVARVGKKPGSHPRRGHHRPQGPASQGQGQAGRAAAHGA